MTRSSAQRTEAGERRPERGAGEGTARSDFRHGGLFADVGVRGRGVQRVGGARRSPVVVRFLEESHAVTPLAVRQLEGRAEFALHAAIGLDSEARDRAEAPAGPARRSARAAGAACGPRGPLRWGPVSPALVNRTAISLIGARVPNRGLDRPAPPRHELGGGDRRLTPTQSAQIVGACTDALDKISDEYIRGDLATILAKEARRLSPEQAVRVMTDALTRNPSPSSFVPCGEGIAAVSQALPPNGAPKRVRPWRPFSPMRSTRATDKDRVRTLADGLAAVAPYLRTERATLTLDALAGAAVRTTDLITLDGLMLRSRRGGPRSGT